MQGLVHLGVFYIGERVQIDAFSIKKRKKPMIPGHWLPMHIRIAHMHNGLGIKMEIRKA